MSDPTIGDSGLGALRPIGQPATPVTRTGAPAEKDFQSFLMASLEKVNQLQLEADAGVQKLLTGQTDNVSEVFSAARKAGIAFDLLMEIRNKLMDAYTELRQMRV